VLDPKIPTACTDGQVLRCNPEYVTTLRTDTVAPIYWAISVVEHETWHAMLGHCKDWTKEMDAEGDLYDRVLANVAQDYAINYIIEQSGRKVHPTWMNGLSDPNRGRFDGKPWTETYLALKKDRKGGKPTPQPQCKVEAQPDAPAAPGSGETAPGKLSLTPSSGPGDPTAKPHNNWDEIVQEATEFAKGRGKLPGGIEEFAKKVAHRQIDWRPVLARYMSRMKMGDYSFRRPNRTYIGTGLIMPVCRSWTAEPLLILDTSGSVWRQVPKFIAHVYDIGKTARVPLWVVATDTKVYDPFLLKRPDDYKRYKVRGGGGTNFVPVFEWLRKRKKPDLVIFFTDGDATYPDWKPGFPVVWCVLDGARRGRCVPFGDQLNLPATL
jgi:predicted metal-dependent peptidase